MELVYTFFTPNKKGLHGFPKGNNQGHLKSSILTARACMRFFSFPSTRSCALRLHGNPSFYKNAVLLCAASTTAC